MQVTAPFEASHEELSRALFEVKLATEVDHPHVVRTLAHAVLRHHATLEETESAFDDLGLASEDVTVTPMLGSGSVLSGQHVHHSHGSPGQAMAGEGLQPTRQLDMGWDDVGAEVDSRSWEAAAVASRSAAGRSVRNSLEIGAVGSTGSNVRSSGSTAQVPVVTSSSLARSSLLSSAPDTPVAGRVANGAHLHLPGAASEYGSVDEVTSSEFLSFKDNMSSATGSASGGKVRRPSATSSLQQQMAALKVSITAVVEYCDKGSLADAIDMGWLRVGGWVPAPACHLLCTCCVCAAACALLLACVVPLYTKCLQHCMPPHAPAALF